jgi:hypothetical protein
VIRPVGEVVPGALARGTLPVFEEWTDPVPVQPGTTAARRNMTDKRRIDHPGTAVIARCATW